MLISAMIGVVLISMVMVSISGMLHSYIQTSNINKVAQKSAYKLEKFNKAATIYFENNSNISSGSTVDVKNLKSNGYLQKSFNKKSPLGQEYRAVYGGGKKVLTYFYKPISKNNTAKLGYKNNSNRAQRSIEEKISQYDAKYVKGTGNTITGWVIPGTKEAQLLMGMGKINIVKSISSWTGINNPNSVIMNNFNNIKYITNQKKRSVCQAHIFYKSGTHKIKVPNCYSGKEKINVVAGGGYRYSGSYWEVQGLIEGSFYAQSGSTLKITISKNGGTIYLSKNGKTLFGDKAYNAICRYPMNSSLKPCSPFVLNFYKRAKNNLQPISGPHKYYNRYYIISRDLFYKPPPSRFFYYSLSTNGSIGITIR